MEGCILILLFFSREEQTLESLQSAGTKNYRLEEVPRWK